MRAEVRDQKSEIRKEDRGKRIRGSEGKKDRMCEG
jgi:hypothetical protein